MPDQSSFAARMRAELRVLEQHTQLRTLEVNSGINLCSNDYLGLATDPRLHAEILEAVSRACLSGSTGSRLLSGNCRDWEELEDDFAAFAGTPVALYFSSGYMANIGLLTSLLRPEDLVFSDSLNHASLIDGIRLSQAQKFIYPHRDLDILEDYLAHSGNTNGLKLIVTETLFSMDGDRAPLLDLLTLARKYGAELVLDEAHATGVLGPSGRGLAAEYGMVDEILAIVHTCGKALASMGALVCSGAVLKQFLINRARPFIYSTAMPPYFAHQIGAALRLASAASAERTALSQACGKLRGALQQAGFDIGSSTSHIVPVILGDNESTLHYAAHLRSNGFSVRAIRPPTVAVGRSRLRLSVTSKITTEQLDKLVSVAIQAKETLGSALHA